MRVIRAGFLSALIWVVVVGFGSTMAWVAIDRFGQDLVVAAGPGAIEDGADTAAIDPILPTSSATAPSGSGTTARLGDQSTAGPTGSASTSNSSGGTPSKGSATGHTSATSRPSATPRHSSPTSSSRVPAGQGNGGKTPTPTAVKRMVRGSAGLISAVCQGSEPRVKYASPQDGWALEVYRRSTAVAVAFHHEDSPKRGFIIFVGCAKGVPVFVTTERGVSVAPDDIRAVLNTRSFVDIATALHWAVAFPKAGDSESDGG